MKRFLKWSGIGCGGLIMLFFLLAILAAALGNNRSSSTPASSPSTQPAQSSSVPASSASSQPAQSPRSPSATPIPLAWQTVKSWTGNGIKQTESFAITSREWRITWQVGASQFGSILQIMVYKDSGELVALAANTTQAGGDTSYVRGQPGRFYLMVNSANADWSVVVEDQR